MVCRAHEWWINTRRDDKKWRNEEDKKSILKMVLCEEHFEKSQFMCPEEKGKFVPRKRLRKDAVPTIFNIPNPPKNPTPSRPLPKRREFYFYG